MSPFYSAFQFALNPAAEFREISQHQKQQGQWINPPGLIYKGDLQVGYLGILFLRISTTVFLMDGNGETTYFSCKLLRGFNPFEKYARQIGSSPQVGRGENSKKSLSCHHPSMIILVPLIG